MSDIVSTNVWPYLGQSQLDYNYVRISDNPINNLSEQENLPSLPMGTFEVLISGKFFDPGLNKQNGDWPSPYISQPSSVLLFSSLI
jgi:hypothetical protein